MEHQFNTTIYNGSLVSTRRGLHISKQKHQGTRFVNTFATESSQAATKPRSNVEIRRPRPPRQDASHNAEREYKFVSDVPREQAVLPRAREIRRPSKRSTPRDSQAQDEVTIIKREEESPMVLSDQRRWLHSTTKGFDVSPAASYNLKHWKSFQFGHDLPEWTQAILQVYLASTPRQLYPCDELLTHNPVQNSNFFERINSSRSTMQSIIMIASLILAVQRGDGAFDEMDSEITQVCGYVNEKLRQGGSRSDLSVMEAIAAMAIAGYFTGRFDHWHVHMRGLRQVIALYGGMRPEWGHVLNKMRKADIKGAAYAGSVPYLSFTRFFPSISDDILPVSQRTEMEIKVQHLLQSYGLPQDLIRPFRELIAFLEAVQIARRSSAGAIRLDPHSFVEEYSWIEYQLVGYSQASTVATPLAEHGDSAASSIQQMTGSTSASSENCIDPYSAAFSAAKPSNCVDVNSLALSKALAETTRLAGILYMEELFPEPHTLDPYAVLFQSLLGQISYINAALFAEYINQQHDYPSVPSLLASTSNVVRPLLIWICMVCCTVARIVNQETTFKVHPVDLNPYLSCLSCLIGNSASKVDELRDRDFEMCRLFPVQMLREASTDDRTLLRRIMYEYESLGYGSG